MSPFSPQRKLNTEVSIPAPLGGINSIAVAGAGPITDCVYLVNMFAAEHGLRTRLGHQRRPGWTGTALSPKELFGYEGPVKDFIGAEEIERPGMLFGTSPSGIHHMAYSGGTVYGFPTLGVVDAGSGTFHAFTTLAGQFCLYTDEAWGYHIYGELSGNLGWQAAGVTTGVWDMSSSDVSLDFDATKMVQVTSWQRRVWLTQRDSTIAWYLAPGAVAGEATPFDFGPKFRRGGKLIGLWSWTKEGGAGLGDALVALSTSGDVVVYEGTDPDTAGEFIQKGVWNVGILPSGRHVATDVGGDLLVMTSLGLVSLAQLVSGANVVDSTQFLTGKIANLFSSMVMRYKDFFGWSVHMNPVEGTLLVCVPKTYDGHTIQLAYSFSAKSWSVYTGLDMSSASTLFGEFFFIKPDGTLWISTGSADGVAVNGSGGTPIPFYGLTLSSDLGTPRVKQVHLIRPWVLSGGEAASLTVVPRYDLHFAEAPAWAIDQLVRQPTASPGEWEPTLLPGGRTMGANGLGHKVALAFKGSAREQVTLAGFDLVYGVGGML